MSQPQTDFSQVDRSNALYERPPVTIADEPTFRTVKSAIESSFAAHNVEKFLRALDRASLRIHCGFGSRCSTVANWASTPRPLSTRN